MKRKVEGWGLADSVVYATGLLKKVKVVTGDVHFQELKNVILIKQLVGYQRHLKLPFYFFNRSSENKREHFEAVP
ncbi:MAG: hypothetical protein QXP27_09530 [Candidatus Methanomethyliaceae archaeon]